METLLAIIIIVASLIVIGVVAQMESAQAGLGTLDGSVESMWGEHRGSSKKDIQNKTVKITSIILAIALIAIVAIR